MKPTDEVPDDAPHDARAPSRVGCAPLTVIDPVQRARVPVHALYPTSAAARAERFGPYPLDVALGAPVVGDALPVVVISHGSGGTPWTHRGLAQAVARSGYVVLAVAHPGNTRDDNALAGTAANLENRPRHLRLALDAAFGSDALGPHLASGDAAVVGHSLGGYAALALVGGRPMALPDQTPDGVARPIAVALDARVRAAVLLAPALPWFMGAGALAEVRVPLLVRAAERDEHSPPGFIEQVLTSLPPDPRLDYRVVPGAGHFAFQTPFPPAMARPDFPPACDPPGFDRAAYEPQLCAEVVAFLRALGAP